MTRNKSNSERTQQLVITEAILNQYCEMIKDHLLRSFYLKPNSKHSTKIIIRHMLMMCKDNASHEGIYQIMKDDLANNNIDDVDVPTGARLLKMTGGTPYRQTRDACDIMLQSTLMHPQIVGMIKNR